MGDPKAARQASALIFVLPAILCRVKPLIDSFWRAAAYCLHPRVIALSLLPLALLCVMLFGLSYFFWDTAIDAVRGQLDALPFVPPLLTWLGNMGFGNLRVVIAPLLVLAIAIPMVVVLCLLVVAVLMTPAMVSLVAERRFATLERKNGASLLVSALWSLASTVAALAAMLVTAPLWLFPLFFLVLPPLIWGWLTYRVMAFDALAGHATAQERRAIFKTHRSTLLGMGVVAGYLGAAPTLLWAWGAMTIALAPILLPVALWMYTLVFAFSSLWFAHHCLAALAQMRSDDAKAEPDVDLRDASKPLTIPAPVLESMTVT